MARWENGEEVCSGSPGTGPGEGEALVGGDGFGISRRGYSPCSASYLASNCSARWLSSEAVDLHKVGEFGRRPDVSASLADLPLEVANDSLQVLLTEARMEEFVPESFPIKAQAHPLASQTAIQRVSPLNPPGISPIYWTN